MRTFTPTLEITKFQAGTSIRQLKDTRTDIFKRARKIATATVGFAMSVRPHGTRLGSHRTDFHEYISQQNALSAIKLTPCEVPTPACFGTKVPPSASLITTKYPKVKHVLEVLVAFTFIINIKN